MLGVATGFRIPRFRVPGKMITTRAGSQPELPGRRLATENHGRAVLKFHRQHAAGGFIVNVLLHLVEGRFQTLQGIVDDDIEIQFRHKIQNPLLHTVQSYGLPAVLTRANSNSVNKAGRTV